MLQDVQERLVFRSHVYMQTDILNYKPAPGDLAYPEKLEMMEVLYYLTSWTIYLKPIIPNSKYELFLEHCRRLNAVHVKEDWFTVVFSVVKFSNQSRSCSFDFRKWKAI